MAVGHLVFFRPVEGGEIQLPTSLAAKDFQMEFARKIKNNMTHFISPPCATRLVYIFSPSRNVSYCTRPRIFPLP